MVVIVGRCSVVREEERKKSLSKMKMMFRDCIQ